MKILLCGEGGHDSGTNRWSERLGKYHAVAGWLQVLLRKLSPEHGEFSFVVLPRSQLGPLRRSSWMKNKPRGHGTKALYAIEAATAEDCDMVVFMVDADSNKAENWKKIREQIITGFKASESTLHGIACVPMSASECWLLSDGDAWIELGLPDKRLMPPKPEEIWGKRNVPTSNHPHQFFRRMCEKASRPDNRETRSDVAAQSQIRELVKACPISFVRFRNDIEAVLQGPLLNFTEIKSRSSSA